VGAHRKIAKERLPAATGDATFYESKLTTSWFFNERLLPQPGPLWSVIKGGKAGRMELEEAAF
jgi:hypothetical protein